MSRLPTGIVASGLLRAAEAFGGNGVVLNRGDPDAGALLVVVTRRGADPKLLERLSTLEGELQWNLRNNGESISFDSVARLIDKKKRFDRDLWVLELDVADAEQFIALTFGQT
ncbi:MAG TPA: DUF1491 family protein [Sphingomonadaceae bacterium]|nr:DUF1491 family protein [Sphingomonadaceae bacterium]